MRPSTSVPIALGYLLLIENSSEGTDNEKTFLKAILTTTAFALALGVSAASLSTAAQAYAYFGN